MKFAILAFSLVVVAKSTEHHASANPIRKVVTMLQKLQAKVTKEGEEEDAMFKKFQCYCDNGASSLQKGIAENKGKIDDLTSDIAAGEEKLAQLKQEVKDHTAARSAAKEAVAKAEAIRKKEADAFAKLKAEQSSDTADMQKAIAALKKGTGSAFLQTPAATALHALLSDSQKVDLEDDDRSQVLAFLAGGEGYAPASGQIIGILEQMLETTAAGLNAATKEEEAAIKAHEGLVAAKKKEIAANSKAIEEKSKRIGELGVEIQQMKNSLAEAEDAVGDDTQFLADLAKNCKTKKAEHDENTKMRGQELTALSETIASLDNDDALDAFGKSGLAGGASLVQVTVSATSMKARALEAIHRARRSGSPFNGKLDFIALALQSRKPGSFDKIIKMIDDMVVTLKTEQTDDDTKKGYCEDESDKLGDQERSLTRDIKDHDAKMNDLNEGIKAVVEEVAALEAQIAADDKQVAEATEQRKEEHALFQTLMQDNGAAKKLIAFAKNRLQKFYNPSLYDPNMKMPGSELAQVRAHMQDHPGEAPPTAEKFSKKHQESNAIMHMMDTLVQDLDKEMTVAETDEKNAEAEYQQMIADMSQKKTDDTTALNDKKGFKASNEAALHSEKAEKKSTAGQLKDVQEAHHILHQDCDWLLQNYEFRKEARTAEIGNLDNAKAVLSGADYSFLQVRTAGFLAK